MYHHRSLQEQLIQQFIHVMPFDECLPGQSATGLKAQPDVKCLRAQVIGSHEDDELGEAGLPGVVERGLAELDRKSVV